MARIAQSVIDRIKSDVSLERLVENSGIPLKPHGQDRIGHCPFHNDKTPSLVISPKSNLWNCLGACQTGGSVIDWVMKSQGISFRHAVELLNKDVSALAAPPKTAKTSQVRKLDVLAPTEDHQALLHQVIDYYHDTLLQDEAALDYLEQRGINDPELIKQFKLGYANRTLGYRLQPMHMADGKAVRTQLQEIGLLRQSGHEHLTGSLVVPIFDDQGNIVEVYGRKTLGTRLRKGTPQHLYLPGPHAGVWNADGLRDQTEVILCEALIDAMTFWCAGYRNVTASYGTSGFTDDHLAVFKQHGIKRVLIAYDRDDAGNHAAENLAKKLMAEGIDCYRLLFPKGMDANAYALQVTPAAKSLGVVIRSAQWMGEGEPPEPPKPTEEKPAAKNEKHDTASTLAAEPPSDEVAEKVETECLPAAAVPPEPVDVVEAEVSEHEVAVNFGERRYRVRGLQKNTSYEVLKVNVLLKSGDVVHVDTFDLYSAKHRQAFARIAAIECDVKESVIQRDLGQLLLQLESLQDQAIQDALKPKEPTAYTMDASERESALQLLRDPELTTRIINDFTQTGLVGEPTNALMGYLAAVSRKLKTPLAIIVQSTSAAGKSALMDAVLKLVPEEDRVHYSAMTGQSLFYLGETNLKHKILGIAEEEGVRQAAYALKLLQSQGELTIASTGKDPQSGKLVTEEYRVEGPVMLFLTTTAIDIDEELLNRCVVLTIDESRDQTAAIQQRQRQARTLEGLLASNHSEQLIQQHQNAQRLLRPLAVVNPYAEQLSFANSRTRTRRDHEKYLTLIDSIALLHQYQREVKRVANGIEYIEVTKSDIALANHLAHDILGRSLDELPPPTRRVLQSVYQLVQDAMQKESLRQHEVRFTRRDVREAAGLSDKQVRVHLDRLVELEYVFTHYGRNGQRFVYELVFDGETEQNQRQLMGLIDSEQLENTGTTSNLVATDDKLVPSSGPASAEPVASLSTPKNTVQPSNGGGLATKREQLAPNALITGKTNGASHRTITPLAAATAEV